MISTLTTMLFCQWMLMYVILHHESESSFLGTATSVVTPCSCMTSCVLLSIVVVVSGALITGRYLGFHY